MAGRADIEGPIHRSILRYLRTTLPHGYVVQHTANKPRSERSGRAEKALGSIAGWPDLAIYGQIDGAARAWFLEVKPPRVTVPDHQREVHDKLMAIGFPVRIARSVDDAKRAVWDWGLPSLDASLKTEKLS
jgi:hypothetical protein